MYLPLTQSSARDYILASHLMGKFFSQNAQLECHDLALGNVNLVFRVFDQQQPEISVIVKQALPHARRFPEFKMPLERAALEAELLGIYGELCPALAPKLHWYDETMKVNVLEDLNRHSIMRDALMRQELLPNFARDLGLFLAHTTFFSSDFFLASEVKKARVARFMNPVLCKVTEDLVFSFPTIPHTSNRFSAGLATEVQALHNNSAIRAEVLQLQAQFMNNAQALLHGDLHTGSIMVNSSETKVIDPEFCFYGPISFDVGNVIGNLLLSFASQSAHAANQSQGAEYRQFLKESINQVWNTFASEFLSLWRTRGNSEFFSEGFAGDFLSSVFSDSLGMAGCEMIRRLVGLAHVPDLESIEDPSKRVVAEKFALQIAERLLLERREFVSIEAVTDSLESEDRTEYPKSRISSFTSDASL